ncbi:MAG: hypothetical protein ABI791_09165 [Acidobacteriota bacterium]
MINNKSKINLILALLVLAAVTLSCSFLRGGSRNSQYGVGDVKESPLPSVDVNEPFPAMSTDTINVLVAEVPELAKHRDEILKAERSAINSILADVREGRRANSVGSNLRSVSFPFDPPNKNHALRFNLIPAALAADNPPVIPDMGGVEYFLIGHQAGFLTPDFDKVRDTDLGRSKTETIKSDSTGEVIATTTVTVGTDGTVTSEMSTNINMPVLGLNANSKVKVQGNQCPTSDGKIELMIELSSNGRAGSSGSMIYDKTITGRVTATVDNDAEIATIDFDLKQATRSTAGGRQVYVETSQAGQSTNGKYSGFEYGDPKIIRASSQATAADAELSQAGLRAAFNLAEGILENAKGRWQGGGCVRIVANSPGNVEINSTNQIPVTVMHQVDGSEVPSKLEAVLSGEASIDPAVVPKTAGTLTYVAPAESGKSATIKLTAKSKRGIAKLELSASTGGNSYQVVGGLDDWQTSTRVCDIMKPFRLTGSYGIVMELTGGLSGSYSYHGQYQMQGSGTYTISLPDGPGKPGKMVGTGPGSAMGHRGSGTENYTLTPIEPCS